MAGDGEEVFLVNLHGGPVGGIDDGPFRTRAVGRQLAVFAGEKTARAEDVHDMILRRDQDAAAHIDCRALTIFDDHGITAAQLFDLLVDGRGHLPSRCTENPVGPALSENSVTVGEFPDEIILRLHHHLAARVHQPAHRAREATIRPHPAVGRSSTGRRHQSAT